jgi:hypothetical protein
MQKMNQKTPKQLKAYWETLEYKLCEILLSYVNDGEGAEDCLLRLIAERRQALTKIAFDSLDNHFQRNSHKI